jgi:hypothetical protein
MDEFLGGQNPAGLTGEQRKRTCCKPDGDFDNLRTLKTPLGDKDREKSDDLWVLAV